MEATRAIMLANFLENRCKKKKIKNKPTKYRIEYYEIHRINCIRNSVQTERNPLEIHAQYNYHSL